MSDSSQRIFEAMVESVGVKAFAGSMDLSTRQIHRMLSGTQPNPIQRLCEALGACEGLTAQQALDYICQENDGHFVPVVNDLRQANVNAVKECAEAIVAISEGRSVRVTIKEIREAIAALLALERRLKEQQ